MTKEHQRRGEEGYLLVGLVVACFLVLLALAVAAPRMAKELERDREIESEHRALEYVRAIQLYYRKNNSFPTTVEQLLGSGTTGSSIGGIGQVKYLRQKYKDPLTNDEFRLIHAGEAQTQVKGFFGEPLDGAPIGAPIGGTVNPGAAATAIGGSTPGTSAGSGFSLGTPQVGTPPGASSSGTTSAGGASGTGTNGAGSSASSSSSTSGSSTDATTFQGSKGAVVGVGSNAKGPGIVEWNGSADISAWEFLYDPRVELLKAKVSLFGGSPAANGSGSLGGGFAPIGGSTPGTSFGGSAPGTGITGGIGTSGTGTTPTGSGTGTTPPPATPNQ